jgi:predicted ribosome quality control (RQC) complex YloA/Tae2 family protein
MGLLGNVLLLDAGDKILECVRRVPGGEHARRVLLPGRQYAPPPAQEKLPPVDDGRADYYERLAAVTAEAGSLWKAVVAHVAGVSPTQAREIAWRATGKTDAAARDAQTLAVAQALQELWSPVQQGGWLPGNVMEGEAVVGFSAYPVHFRGRFLPRSSMSEALEQYYASPRKGHSQRSDGHAPDEYAAARAQAAVQVRQSQQRVRRQLEALAADEPAPGEPEALRAEAEWLLALAYSVQPHQETLEVDVYGDGSEILRIALDRQRTPVEQAQRMFKRAAKLERAAEIIPRRRAKLETDLEFLAQLETDLAMAENRPEIAAVQEELRAGGFVKAGPKTKREKTPSPRVDVRRFTSPDGYEILAGRNARQNEAITFRMSHPQDVWLHARGVPGAHVVIRSSGNRVSEAGIRMAAQVAAYYSEARGERSAAVTMTERRHVRRLPGGHTGQVLVRNEETVHVPAEMPPDIE